MPQLSYLTAEISRKVCDSQIPFIALTHFEPICDILQYFKFSINKDKTWHS